MTAKTKLRLSIVIVLTALATGATSPDILSDRDVGGIRNSVVVLSEPPTITGLEKLYAAKAGKPYVVSVSQFFQSKFDASEVLSGKGATDLDSAAWYKQYKEYLKHAPENMGEIIQVGSDALIRTIQAGKFQQKGVSGNNPLTCISGESGCEIIWIRIGIIPPHQEKKYLRPRISLFARTEHLPSTQESERLAHALQRRFDTELLTVSFRTDSWFIEDAEFPISYPFKSNPRIVGPGEIDIRHEVTCVAVGADFRCSKVF